MKKKVFNLIYTNKLEHERNLIVYALKVSSSKEIKNNEEIIIIEKEIIQDKKSIDNNYKMMLKGLK